jgi:hypothetical protein
LEAAPANMESKLTYWIPRYLREIPKIESGNGQINTKKLMDYVNENCGIYNNEIPPIRYCSTLEVNGYKDWYLPSQWELGQMCRNLHVRGLGKFNDENYWSSNNNGSVYIEYRYLKKVFEVYGVNFMNGENIKQESYNTYRVRAARRF